MLFLPKHQISTDIRIFNDATNESKIRNNYTFFKRTSVIVCSISNDRKTAFVFVSTKLRDSEEVPLVQLVTGNVE
jgi:hypothetical protein